MEIKPLCHDLAETKRPRLRLRQHVQETPQTVEPPPALLKAEALLN